MKRVYVIMKEHEEENYPVPFDVVSSMTKAEEICLEEEAKPENEYYIFWYQSVISSEGDE